MHEGTAIRIPQEYVNDDTVKLLRWFVEEDEEVQEGQTLAELETSKAVVELLATAGGKVRERVAAGGELRVGAIVGYIAGNGHAVERLRAVESDREKAIPATEQLEDVPSGIRFSKKARELLTANAILPLVFEGRGLVREQDVLEYLQRRGEKEIAASELHFALNGISLERVSLPKTFGDREKGTVESEFLAQLRKDPETFGQLSSAERCEVYRNHGAIVGEGVSLGVGTVLISPQIVIGDRVQFGSGSSVQCREAFFVGRLTSFRKGFSVRGGTVVLGENLFGGGNVQIGGGGNGDPYAVLGVGDGTYIGDDVFINICRPVLIGREVFLTQRSILVTHNIGHSILEGYENRFAPIVLEDYSQVGMNSTIYAGSRVGRGSIVMSNSYVVSSIPAGKLAAGIPARVIRDAARPMNRERQLEIVKEMMREYYDLLLRKGHTVSPLQKGAYPCFEMRFQEKRFQLLFVENLSDTPPAGEEIESIVWTFQNFCSADHRNATIIDLLAKTIAGSGGVFVETTREFLRKRGIRLEPGPWRYAGGLI